MKKLSAVILALALVLMMAVPASAQAYTTFDGIFSDHGIVHFRSLFMMLDYYAYAYATADGVIDCLEFGVDGNTICEWVESIYILTDGLTEEDIDFMEYDMLMTFAAADAEDFCTVTSHRLYNHLVISIAFTDLEYKENITRMADLGFIGYDADYLGLEITEQNLLAQGYVKDY